MVGMIGIDFSFEEAASYGAACGVIEVSLQEFGGIIFDESEIADDDRLVDHQHIGFACEERGEETGSASGRPGYEEGLDLNAGPSQATNPAMVEGFDSELPDEGGPEFEMFAIPRRHGAALPVG